MFRLEDGFSWDKLCGFLDHDIPEEPYPNAYGKDHFHTRWANVLRPKMWSATWKLLGFLAIPATGVWATSYFL